MRRIQVAVIIASIWFALALSGVAILVGYWILTRSPQRAPGLAAGAILWSVGFVLLGYSLRESWRLVEHWMGTASAIVGAVVGLIIGLVWLGRWLARHEAELGRWWAGAEPERHLRAVFEGPTTYFSVPGRPGVLRLVLEMVSRRNNFGL